MRIKSIQIKNFRLFGTEPSFEIENLNVPNGKEGSGITVFVGENGCGKTSILDAISLPLLSYKAESISIEDFNEPNQKLEIEIFSDKDFNYKGTMPNAEYIAKGFRFEASLRSRGNSSYLSSVVVSDQKFLKADGQDMPKDHSPDLRLNVNNPFSGKRFDENDIVYLDKNRTYQIRSGIYNTTRFDRLMEDFDYQYIKSLEEPPNHNQYVDENLKKDKVNHEYLGRAIQEFETLSGIRLSLDIFDNWSPFRNGFLAERKENNIQVKLDNQGSGYEMIFSLIYSFNLAKQSGKQLIILIDEPELHLHPKLQEKFVEYLFKISSETQIFLTSHSPLLVKQLLKNDTVKIHMLKKDGPTLSKISQESISLPYLSSNEVNYIAFNLATPELHNELYGHLQEVSKQHKSKDFDIWLQEGYGLTQDKTWQELKNGSSGNSYSCTLQTYIRHFIHHPENKLNDEYTDEELKESCDQMLRILKTYNKQNNQNRYNTDGSVLDHSIYPNNDGAIPK